MPQWLRTLVMIAGLLGWGTVIAVSLLKGQLPDAVLLGVPGALWLALAPPSIGRRGGGTDGPGGESSTS